MASYHRRAGWRSRKRFGEFVDTRSVGAAIWEMTHPDQVQREYQAVGKSPPDYADIYSGALDDAITAARESAQNVGAAAQAAVGEAVSVGKLALLAVALGLVVFILERKK